MCVRWRELSGKETVQRLQVKGRDIVISGMTWDEEPEGLAVDAMISVLLDDDVEAVVALSIKV